MEPDTQEKTHAYHRKQGLLLAGLRTAALEYVPWDKADITAFTTYMSADNCEWIKVNGWDTHDAQGNAHVYEPEAVLNELGRRYLDNGHLWIFLVKRRGSEHYLGECEVRMEPDGKTADIGYFVLPTARRQGLASTMVSDMSAGLAAKAPALGIHTIAAECEEENIPANRVLEKAGYMKIDAGLTSYAVALDGTPSSLAGKETLHWQFPIIRNVSRGAA